MLGRSAPSLLFHGALRIILLSADFSAVFSRIPSDFVLVNIAFEVVLTQSSHFGCGIFSTSNVSLRSSSL